MSLDQLNQDAASLGGSWLKLRNKADGTIEGTVVSYEKRERRTPEGDVVFKKGTTTPRYVWTFTLQLDDGDARLEGPDDDGLRKFDANESAQRAIATAIKASGKPAAEGDRLKIAVKDDPESDFSQPEYQAKWTPGAPPLAIDEDEWS